MKIIIQITKQEAIDAYRKLNKVDKDTKVEIEYDTLIGKGTTTLQPFNTFNNGTGGITLC